MFKLASETKIILNDAEASVFIEDPSGNTYLMDGQGNINVNAPKNMTFTAGENVTITAGMNITAIAGMNISETAGMNHSSFAGAMMMQNAVADYSLMAANITNIASDKITKEATDYTKHAEKIELYASKENVQIKSAKTVQLNSGENSNLH